MASFFARAAEQPVEKLAQSPLCARALEWIERNARWVTEQQVRVTEIPAPEWQEAGRAEYMRRLFEEMRFDARIDQTGNVVAERPGVDPEGVILLAAHLDTVFPAGTDARVKRNGARLQGPGISDNGAGLAAILGVARAFAESPVRTAKTVVFAGDVGEEGEGNLRGIRALVEHYGSRLSAVIAVDGPSIEHITVQGIASRRFEITVKGPGGHSWSDFGRPNPITALSRGIVRFSSVSVSQNPRTSFNFGSIAGGTSVNSIPAQASVKVDLRSESESELARLEASLREAMRAAIRQETEAVGAPSSDLELNFRSLGSRPAGKLPENSPLLDVIREIDSFLGNQSRIEHSSTDANIPLSLGIPAISLGGGGTGGGAHTASEWYDPTGRALGLKRLYLVAIALAGIRR
ncbi:MAG TPA: M20/M25/M40 family metallo-hydrolase [Candidatus Acidoferrales bacterium]|nr:M20/M25/M40 family metallo-hydrolase [Candidatus Acidoferrales bacterium]